MKRNVVALVNGYAKVADLYALSFAQLRKLREQGVIDRIVYVTWDSPRIDACLRPLESMPDVEVVRIPEPKLHGAPLQNGVTYQIQNFEASLALVEDDETLVLKTRPDFIFTNEEFLKRKILDFDTLCAPSDLPAQLGIDCPAPCFGRKVWVPWANASEPLFLCDVSYLGRKGDLVKLADHAAERYLPILSDGRCDRITHIARALNIFEPHYPILRRYGESIRVFISTPEYRDYFAFLCARQPFFRYLALINAWILATHFHVDCGHASDLMFFSNRTNQTKPAQNLRDLTFETLYTSADLYRRNMTPGSLAVATRYSIATLTGDAWQHALFTHDRVDSYTHEEIRTQLQQAITYDPAAIGECEDAFYRAAEAHYQTYIAENPGVIGDEGVIEDPSRIGEVCKTVHAEDYSFDNVFANHECQQREIEKTAIESPIGETYGEHGEDAIVDAIFRAVFFAKRRDMSSLKYAEIGAGHPIQNSASYLFHRVYGATGVLVEPVPQQADTLRRIRPNDTVLACAIGATHDAYIEVCVHEKPDLTSQFPAYLSRFTEHGGAEKIVEKIRCKNVHINDFLDRFAAEGLDFLSIDTVGGSLAIVRAMDGRVKPTVIQCDHQKKIAAFSAHLSRHGYVLLAMTDTNALYMLRDAFADLPSASIQA